MVSRKSEDILVVFQTGQHDLYFVSVCLVEICQIYIFLWGGGGFVICTFENAYLSVFRISSSPLYRGTNNMLTRVFETCCASLQVVSICQ